MTQNADGSRCRYFLGDVGSGIDVGATGWSPCLTNIDQRLNEFAMT